VEVDLKLDHASPPICALGTHDEPVGPGHCERDCEEVPRCDRRLRWQGLDGLEELRRDAGQFRLPKMK
jgi:hypothetical protein